MDVSMNTICNILRLRPTRGSRVTILHGGRSIGTREAFLRAGNGEYSYFSLYNVGPSDHKGGLSAGAAR